MFVVRVNVSEDEVTGDDGVPPQVADGGVMEALPPAAGACQLAALALVAVRTWPADGVPVTVIPPTAEALPAKVAVAAFPVVFWLRVGTCAAVRPVILAMLSAGALLSVGAWAAEPVPWLIST